MSAEKIRKSDLVLIGIILLTAVFLILVREFSTGSGSKAVIYLNNEIYAEADLNTDALIDVEQNGNVINTVRISDGFASMERATCPDGLCLRQQKIQNSGESLCCLPNRVYVEVVSDDSGEYDAITK